MSLSIHGETLEYFNICQAINTREGGGDLQNYAQNYKQESLHDFPPLSNYPEQANKLSDATSCACISVASLYLDPYDQHMHMCRRNYQLQGVDYTQAVRVLEVLTGRQRVHIVWWRSTTLAVLRTTMLAWLYHTHGWWIHFIDKDIDLHVHNHHWILHHIIHQSWTRIHAKMTLDSIMHWFTCSVFH